MTRPPGTDELEEFAAFAGQLAKAAGEAVLPFFRAPVKVSDKNAGGAFDPVTEADHAAELVMRRMIEQHYPGHGIRGEEFDDHKPDADLLWVLDPIDGTKSFIIGFPLWGTMIGLLHRGAPVLGLVSQPFTGEVFSGAAGRATYSGPRGARTLKVRSCADLSAAMLATTSPLLIEKPSDRARFAELETKVRLSRYGGDCYGYCMIADGLIDLVAETGLKMHDVAPLIPIIEGAGGIVTDWNGGPAVGGGRILAAGDARIHAAAVAILSA